MDIVMRARAGSLLLTLASLVFLGLYLAARVYNSYDMNGLEPGLVYQTIVAIALISPIVMILTLLARPPLVLRNGKPVVSIGLAVVAFWWMFMAGTLSIILGL